MKGVEAVKARLTEDDPVMKDNLLVSTVPSGTKSPNVKISLVRATLVTFREFKTPLL